MSTALLLVATMFPDAGMADTRIEEVVVTVASREHRALPLAVQLDQQQIAKRAPFDLKDILEALPSVSIRTNSRGEAVLRLRGSEGVGVEMMMDWTINDRFNMCIRGNWQDLETRREEDGSRPGLFQRPRFQAAITLDYLPSVDWDLFVELRHMGHALDEDEDGSVITLPTATTLNIRLFRTVHQNDREQWRVCAGVEKRK